MRNVQNIGGAIHSLNDAQLGNVWTLMQARNVRNVRVEEIKGGGAEGGLRAMDSLLSTYSGKLKTLRTSQVSVPALSPQTKFSARSWSLIGH